MLNTFSRSLIIWEPAIKTWAQEMNEGGNELGARRAEQFPTLAIILLTPAGHDMIIIIIIIILLCLPVSAWNGATVLSWWPSGCLDYCQQAIYAVYSHRDTVNGRDEQCTGYKKLHSHQSSHMEQSTMHPLCQLLCFRVSCCLNFNDLKLLCSTNQTVVHRNTFYLHYINLFITLLLFFNTSST